MFTIDVHVAAILLALMVLALPLIDTIYAYKEWVMRWWEEKFPKKP